MIFLPGAACTVQEIFDNATPNYYGSRGRPTPMVLAGSRPMESRIALVDTVDEAAGALARLSAKR